MSTLSVNIANLVMSLVDQQATDDNGFWMPELATVLSQVRDLESWKSTVLNELMSVHAISSAHDIDPHRAVNDLISYHIKASALDA